MASAKRIGEVLLQADHISLAFGGIRALADISLEIREHEILAIIGPNGAGKTSMLNVINGFYHPQPRVGPLPWGRQKGVGLGRAPPMKPDRLLLDEPMAGMNVEEKEDMSRF